MVAQNFFIFIDIWIIDLSVIYFVVYIIVLSVTGENGNTAEGITRDKILNQPVLEEGTFLSYASKVVIYLYDFPFFIFGFRFFN